MFNSWFGEDSGIETTFEKETSSELFNTWSGVDSGIDTTVSTNEYSRDKLSKWGEQGGSGWCICGCIMKLTKN